MSVSIIKIVLMDVQGMWGGNNIYLFQNQASFIQVVDRAMYEQRYQVTLADSEWRQLESLIMENNFFDIEVAERFGVPGEARPTITISTNDGREKIIAKWANDKHAGFDAVYKYLLKIAKDSQTSAPVFSGNYDAGWRP